MVELQIIQQQIDIIAQKRPVALEQINEMVRLAAQPKHAGLSPAKYKRLLNKKIKSLDKVKIFKQ